MTETSSRRARQAAWLAVFMLIISAGKGLAYLFKLPDDIIAFVAGWACAEAIASTFPSAALRARKNQP